MSTIAIYNQSGEKTTDRPLAASVFGVAVKPSVVHQVVVALLAQARPVVADTKGRGEVRGGGKKPWKQKGTGRARHGSIRSPLWRGGGITFGPTSERNFKLKINKKVKQQALRMALSDKAVSDLVVIDALSLPEAKTKNFFTILRNLKLRPAKTMSKEGKKEAGKSILVVVNGKDEAVTRAGRNIAGVKIVSTKSLSVLDVVQYQKIMMPVNALETVEKALAR